MPKFEKGTIYYSADYAAALIKKRGHICEKCGATHWNDQPIPLQVHHRDGDRQNNEETNLELLCPNCHAQTPNHSKNNKQYSVTDEELAQAIQNSTSIHQALMSVGLSTTGVQYARANRIMEDYNIKNPKELQEQKECKCEKCGALISRGSKLCVTCFGFSCRKTEHPSREQLKQEIRTIPFTTLGKKYGVSDNAIRKWCISYGLPKSKKEILAYSDEEWGNI